MPLYFFLHDAARFHGSLRPALAGAWRERRFGPCRALCAELAREAAAFAARYHLPAEETLLARVAAGSVPFERNFWRQLVGEALLYGAADVPEIITAADLLCGRDDRPERADFSPMEQAHYGSQDIAFGGVYRPSAAGLNDVDDVARLAEYLEGIDPSWWELPPGPSSDELSEEERAEAEEYARAALVALGDLYRGAAAAGRLVISEEL